MTYAAVDGDRVPWLADADAVDFARGERVGGKRRAGNDDLDILIGTNADTCEPVAQHVIVARIAMDDAEAQSFARRDPRVRYLLQRRADPDRITQRIGQTCFFRELGREGDGIAVETQNERHRERHCGTILSKRCGDGKRRDHMRRIGVTIEQPVAHGRPGHVADKVDRDPLGGGEADFVGKNRQRGVDEWQEADTEALAGHSMSPISASLVTIASAISEMRRLVRIACPRSRA